MLEHFWVHYAYRTVFPFGLRAPFPSLDANGKDPFRVQYMLLAAYFSFVRGFMIGLAAASGSNFSSDRVIRCTRALEHCTSYSSRVLAILFAKGITTAGGQSLLTQGPMPFPPRT
jgi:hypothetical protein